MIYLPPVRRFLLPAIIFVTFIISYRALPIPTSLPSFVLHPAPPPPQGIHVPISGLQRPLPIANSSYNHLSPPNQYYYSYPKNEKIVNEDASSSEPRRPELDLNLKSLFKCPIKANKYTSHLRLPDIVQNISQISPGSLKPESRVFWNPTVIALPYWSENQYLIVSRIVTDGNHQENVFCEANVCHIGPGEDARPGEKQCTEDDLRHVGLGGGMRCASSPVILSVPPTPAEKCEGKFMLYVDIPGFHDPRIFWSGKGEPLMMVNTQSRYACFGLWIIDLRTLHSPLEKLLTSSPTRPSLGPLKSYPTLTELTRNPADTRSQIEKNWFLFFTSSGESYIHYDLSDPRGGPRGRTFAKLLGNGLTTTNLTDQHEQPCLRDLTAVEEPDKMKRGGTWHQATNSLRLILCDRFDYDCKTKPENTVFFAVVHRKFPNWLKLPLRYERYFMVWSATPPFEMLGISQHPILMSNETASGWSASENWDDDADNAEIVAMTKKTAANASEPFGGKDYWAYFTYTVSISYSWGRQPRAAKDGGDEAQDMHVGYLDDEVLLAIGVDDKGQAFSRAKAGSLVQCLRACPGRMEAGPEKTAKENFSGLDPRN